MIKIQMHISCALITLNMKDLRKKILMGNVDWKTLSGYNICLYSLAVVILKWKIYLYHVLI